jgi:ERCC4-type nuclease
MIPSRFNNPAPLAIVIDTREQTPWAFPPELATVSVGTLKTGDYALAGDAGFAIERKSLPDFVGTVVKGWERFQREIWRMNGWPAKIIIVEADFRQLCYRYEDDELRAPDHESYRVKPGFLMRRIAELSMMGVAVIFAGDAEHAAILAVKILQQRRNEIETKR